MRQLLVLLLSVGLTGACSRAPERSAEEPAPAGSAASADPGRPLPSPFPDVVARVNGRPIGLMQIVPVAREELLQLPQDERDARRPEALRRALERYIDRDLLLQEALDRGVEADSRAVDWAFDQARREYPDEAAWTEELVERGLDPQSFKSEVRVQHTVSALVEQEAGGLEVSDEEVRAAFESQRRASGEGAELPAFETVREPIRDLLRRRKREQAAEALVRKLRARARIEIFI